MTRSELIKKISARYPSMFLKDILGVVDVVFEEIANAMTSEQRVEIRGFGAFTVRKRKARTARNPRTNAVVSLGERFTPYFRAGKELRVRLNKK